MYGDKKWSDEFTQRYEAWRDALIAMNRAIEKDTREAWSGAASAWCMMAELHEGMPRDQQIYNDLAKGCAARAKKAAA